MPDLTPARQAWLQLMAPAQPMALTAWWRLAFGLSIIVFAVQGWPHIDEQFTRNGLQMVDGLATARLSQSTIVHLLSALTIMLATAVMVGIAVPIAAGSLWVVTMVLLEQNGLSRSPEMSLVHLSLLLLVAVPSRLPRLPWRAVDGDGIAPVARIAAWAAFAVSYGTAGVSKLIYDDSSWLDGSALGYVFNDSVFRRLWYGDLFVGRFTTLLQLGTYASLAVEVGAPLLALFHRGRCLAWSMSFTMHLLALVFLNLTEVSVHMLVFHLLLIDQRMVNDGRRLWVWLHTTAQTFAVYLRGGVSASVAVDPRASVWFRQAIGLVAAIDAVQRVSEAPFFLSNDGWQGGTSSSMELPYVYLWLLIEGVAGTAVMLGRHTLVAALCLYATLVVINVRQQFAQTGGDTMLVLAVVWMLALGATRKRGLSLLIVPAYLAHLVLIYGSSLWFKMQHAVWRDGRASCLALLADDYALAPALWLRPYCAAGGVFHWPVLIVEGVAPMAMVWLVLSHRHPRLQAAVLAAIVAMHLGFAVTLNVWLFSIVSCVLWIPFIPSLVIDRLQRRSVSRAARKRVVVNRLRIVSAWLLLAMMTVVIAVGVADRPRVGWFAIVGIEQRWRMFARDDWDIPWVVVPVLLSDGTVVDGRRRGLPVTWAKPDNLAATFPSLRELSFWRRLPKRQAVVDQLARSYCQDSPQLPAGVRPVAVKVVRLRQPVDMQAMRPRRHVVTNVVADISCTNKKPDWPAWTTPAKKLQLGGEPLPFSTTGPILGAEDKNLPHPPTTGRVKQ